MPDRSCFVEGCRGAYAARGLCYSHWAAWRKTADPSEVQRDGRKPRPVRLCSIEGCEAKHEAKGLCQRHYVLQKRNGVPERQVRPPRQRTDTPCSIDGCEKSQRGRGYCDSHLWRMRKHGDPMKVMLIRDDPVKRFLSKVDKNGPDGCWLWQGAKFASGYGRFCYGPKSHIMAHRFAHENFIGPIPDGLQVDHLCFVRHCVNPAHLEAVTGVENRRRRRPWKKKKVS